MRRGSGNVIVISMATTLDRDPCDARGRRRERREPDMRTRGDSQGRAGTRRRPYALTPMAGHHFRAGVVAVVRRADGRVLAFERADLPGQWQLPQGGLDRGESPEQAAWRELEEET